MFVFKKMNVCAWFINEKVYIKGLQSDSWFPPCPQPSISGTQVCFLIFSHLLVEGTLAVSAYKYKQIEMHIFFLDLLCYA